MNRMDGAIINKKGDEMAEFTLRVDGMHCGACVKRVSQALESTPGIKVGDVRVGAARISSEQNPAPVDAAIASLAKAGYAAHLKQ